MQPDGTPGTVLRQHDSTRPRLGGRRKRGQHRQALGRSRGGFSTKIHLKTDLDGNPLDFHLTRGEASDSTQFETSLNIGPDIRPRIAITDKGYDSQANRAAARARGITPIIPRRENSKQRGRFFPKRLYQAAEIRPKVPVFQAPQRPIETVFLTFAITDRKSAVFTGEFPRSVQTPGVGAAKRPQPAASAAGSGCRQRRSA